MVEAAEAAALPSPTRGRLAQIRTDELVSKDSLPSRAGSLPLPLPAEEAAQGSTPIGDAPSSAAMDM